MRAPKAVSKGPSASITSTITTALAKRQMTSEVAASPRARTPSPAPKARETLAPMAIISPTLTEVEKNSTAVA